MADANLKRVFLVMGICVCLASAALSGLCGAWAAILYNGYSWAAPPEDGPRPIDERMEPLGMIVGGLAGLGAGILWTYVMQGQTLRTLARSNRIRGWLVGSGLLLGIAVGVLATILLHTVLGLASDYAEADGIISNMWGASIYFGLPAGGLLGLISGFIWYGACAGAHRQSLAVWEPRW